MEWEEIKKKSKSKSEHKKNNDSNISSEIIDGVEHIIISNDKATIRDFATQNAEIFVEDNSLST